MKLFITPNLTQKEREKASRYWAKFYKLYTTNLYKKGCFDNYVGLHIKCIRSFMNYLINERSIMVGCFHKQFYCPKEEIQIVVLSHEQLNYLIYDEELSKSLPANLKIVKDIFVFGCTVGLRVSDLLLLTEKNLLKSNKHYYLRVKSKKTSTYTSIKLPDYVMDILERYKTKKHKTLFPSISCAWFNKQLKKLAEYIPNNYEMKKIREQKGKQTIQYKDARNKVHYTFSGLITTHTMRRTAITMMLTLGVPENVVRKISGHAPNSKEFFRYVEYSQSVLDQETEKYFNRMKKLSKEYTFEKM